MPLISGKIAGLEREVAVGEIDGADRLDWEGGQGGTGVADALERRRPTNQLRVLAAKSLHIVRHCVLNSDGERKWARRSRSSVGFGEELSHLELTAARDRKEIHYLRLAMLIIPTSGVWEAVLGHAGNLRGAWSR
jgi:hypothetical protein